MPYWEFVYVVYWTAAVVAAAGSVVVTAADVAVTGDEVGVFCACAGVSAGDPGEFAVPVVHPALKIPSTSITTIRILNAIFVFFISIRSLY
jgi:hypothetical protein